MVIRITIIIIIIILYFHFEIFNYALQTYSTLHSVPCMCSTLTFSLLFFSPPQVLRYEQHHTSADLWSFAVCIFDIYRMSAERAVSVPFLSHSLESVNKNISREETCASFIEAQIFGGEIARNVPFLLFFFLLNYLFVFFIIIHSLITFIHPPKLSLPHSTLILEFVS